MTDAPDASDRFPNWSPDATRIAFHRQDLGEPGTPKRVHLVRVGGGGDHRSVVPLLNRSVGRQRFGRFPWSPDGRWFALHVETDEGCAARVVNERGEDSGWRWEEGAVTETAFSPAEDRLLCALEDRIVWVSWPEGRTLSRLPLNFGTGIRASTTGRQIAFGARSGEVWFLGGDSRLYRWDGADDRIVVAEHTDDTKPSCRVEEFALRADDGLELHAQRLIPAAPAALAVLYVHGGPGATLDADDSWALQLVASGYEVVRVAYRGSSGYGGRLKTANTGCYGVCDVRDVIDAGVRWQGSFGRGRPLALFGDSYGGYLSLMALARSDSPFSCAICTCPAINMLTHPLHRDRALPADPERRRQALQDRSVFAAAAHIGRPVLLFHGALDTVATTQQMRELAKQISAAGGPCDLVVFEDDTHSLARHRSEVRRRSERFLAQLAMH